MSMGRAFEKPFTVIALLLSTGAISSVWLLETNVSSLDTTEGDVRGQLLWTAIYIVVLFLCMSIFPNIIHRLSGARWQLYLVALAVTSVAWSAIPDYSLRRAAALMGTTALGVYFGVRYSLIEQLKLIGWMFALSIAFSIMAVVVIPDFALMPDYDGAFRGVFNHKNTAGTLMALALAVFFQLYLAGKRRLLYAVLAGLAGILVILSHSATAVVIVAVFVAAAPACWALRLPRRQAFVILAAWFSALLASVGWALVNFDEAAAVLGRNATLTGRTGLWQFAFSAVMKRPVFGYGYEGFWQIYGEDAKAVAGWVAPHAHNGYLQLTLNLGFVGLVMFVLGYIRVFRQALRLTKQQITGAYWPLLFLSFFAIYSITLPGILERNNFLWIVFVAVSISLDGFCDRTEVL